MIIGIAGTLGAGKGTAVERIKSYGFSHYSSSGTLKHILTERGLAHTRLNMSTLANELNENREGGILGYSHEMAVKNGDKNFILESIHRLSEAEYIKKIGGVILGIDTAIELRYKRAFARQEGEKDNVTFLQFKIDSEREDEGKTGSGPNIKEVLKSADYVLFNNSNNIEDFYRQIDEFVDRYNR